MLSKFFESRARIHALRDDPAGALFEGFAQALSEMGYADFGTLNWSSSAV
jgi:hypothetical protein